MPDRHEKFCYPKLGVWIDVHLADKQTPHVKVEMSDEVFSGAFDPDRWPSIEAAEISDDERSSRRHLICNRLHIAGLALDILLRHEDDEAGNLGQTLEMAIESLTELEALA